MLKIVSTRRKTKCNVYYKTWLIQHTVAFEFDSFD